MKWVVQLVLIILVLVPVQTWAQDGNTIILSDSNPSVSAVIDLPLDTTGVVTVDLSMALVTITDTNGKVVFSSADSRVHHLELNIAPNTGSHTLTLQRLPGVAQASATVGSQADFTLISPATPVDMSPVSLNQSLMLSLDATHPAEQVSLAVQPETNGLISAQFPGAVATAQLTDANGLLVASSAHDIDGFNILVDGGNYNLSLQTSTSSDSITAGVSVLPADAFTLLSTPQTQPSAESVATSGCTATFGVNSTNLRSGPGTGYSVLDFAVQGDQFAVGGVNPEHNWIVVGANSGSAWVSRDLIQLDGDCSQLPVYDIPLRNEPVAPVIVQAPSNNVPNASTFDGHEDDDHFEDAHSVEYHDDQPHQSFDDHEEHDD